MQWTDEGIVIGVRRHGEASAILELMTREHGRHLGMVRGGFGTRMKPILQTGNSVSASWRARLDEHLGNYTVEPMRQRASDFFGASHAIYGVTHLAALIRLLPERDPHGDLFAEFERILDRLEDAVWAAPISGLSSAVEGSLIQDVQYYGYGRRCRSIRVCRRGPWGRRCHIERVCRRGW